MGISFWIFPCGLLGSPQTPDRPLPRPVEHAFWRGFVLPAVAGLPHSARQENGAKRAVRDHAETKILRHTPWRFDSDFRSSAWGESGAFSAKCDRAGGGKSAGFGAATGRRFRLELPRLIQRNCPVTIIGFRLEFDGTACGRGRKFL